MKMPSLSIQSNAVIPDLYSKHCLKSRRRGRPILLLPPPFLLKTGGGGGGGGGEGHSN